MTIRRIMGDFGKRRRLVRAVLSRPAINAIMRAKIIFRTFLDFPFVRELVEIIVSGVDPETMKFQQFFNQCVVLASAQGMSADVGISVRKNRVTMVFSDEKQKNAKVRQLASISIAQALVPGSILGRREKSSYTIAVNCNREALSPEFERLFIKLVDKLVFLAVSNGVFLTDAERSCAT